MVFLFIKEFDFFILWRCGFWLLLLFLNDFIVFCLVGFFLGVLFNCVLKGCCVLGCCVLCELLWLVFVVYDCVCLWLWYEIFLMFIRFWKFKRVMIVRCCLVLWNLNLLWVIGLIFLGILNFKSFSMVFL